MNQENAQAIIEDLVILRPRISITRRRDVSYHALKAHVYQCLAGTDIQRRIEEATTARRIERERQRDEEARQNSAKHEAENIYAIVGQHGETVESVRRYSIHQRQNHFAELFGGDFANDIEKFRLDVLDAFDRLATAPPQGLAGSGLQRRAALTREYKRTLEQASDSWQPLQAATKKERVTKLS